MDWRNFKIISLLSILFVLTGCNIKKNKELEKEVDKEKFESSFFIFDSKTKTKALDKAISLNTDSLCLKQVFEKLNISNDCNYSIVESEFKSWESPRKIFYDVSEFKLSKEVKEKLNLFLENNNSETLQIIFMNDSYNDYLIFIGKNLGVTGIGARYNNFLIINLETSFFLEEDSICENPLSVFVDSNGELNMVVLEEDFRNENIEITNSFFYSYFTVDVKGKIDWKDEKKKFICK